MAAPIRVRISKVQFDKNDFNHLIDPFWLLISDAKYPNISDVKKKILSICEDAVLSKRKCSQTNNSDYYKVDGESVASSGTDSENSIVSLLKKWKPETSICQLWLDGCRLPDSEQTAVLRENDSLIVKFAKDSKSRRGFVDSHVSPIQIIGEEENGVIPKQKHRKRNQKQTIDPSHDNNRSFEFEQSFQTKENHPSKKRKHNDDRIVSEGGEEVNVEGSHQKVKKRKKEKEYNNDIEEKIKDESGDVSGRLSVDANKDLQTQQENDKLEKIKQNMLSYLDKHSANLGQCLNLTNDAKSPESNDKDVTSPDIPMPEIKKRKRRRKSKRTKRSEETPKLVKVEDKPRSSNLNLPWDQQPQNTKLTFDSDEEELVESVVTQNECMPNMYEKIKTKDDTEKLQSSKSHISHIDKGTNKTDMTSNSPCTAREEVVNISQARPVISNKTRKYMMRSTMSILDSLKSSSSSDANKPNKNSISPAVTITSHGKSVSPASHASAVNSRSPSITCKPIVTSQSNFPTSALISGSNRLLGTESSKGKPNLALSSGTKASIGKSSSPPLITDSPNKGSSSLSVTNPPLEKSSRQASVIGNSFVGSYVDPSAKFSELLQRRKFSNNTCTVSKTQNGVTVCSRQKSPRGKNAFADPATDMLTNKSTIVKCSGENVELSAIPKLFESHQAKKLTNAIGPMSIGKGDATADVEKDIGCDKVEVIPVDFEKCPLLSGSPQKGDVLAYKVLEMTDDYTPAVSSFKIGKVLALENDSVLLEGFGNSVPKKKGGKFELCYGDEEEEETTDNSQNYDQVSVVLGSMMDTRLVKRECLK